MRTVLRHSDLNVLKNFQLKTYRYYIEVKMARPSNSLKTIADQKLNNWFYQVQKSTWVYTKL